MTKRVAGIDVGKEDVAVSVARSGGFPTRTPASRRGWRGCGGKTGKVALVAVMRKLLLRLHAIAHRGTPWVPDGAPAS